MNHLEVITTTSNKYALAFGFTGEEVFAALGEFGLGDKKEKVKQWYNGFVLGLLVEMEDSYNLVSNRESGFGRYDILLKPKNKKHLSWSLKYRTYDRKKHWKILFRQHYHRLKKKYETELITEGILRENMALLL